MNQEKKVVKISDVIQNQIPEFILSENPNFVEFFKQYYISQEFQGSSIDLAENLIEYKNVDSFDNTNLIEETTLSSAVEFFDDVIEVESTNGWPNQYGLFKIDDEIITYTGITSTSFTGCIRGFSGTSSLSQENNPEFLTFSQTEASEHTTQSTVQNLSNLFLKEFFRKVKYQFTPGFEELDFASQINPQNFISNVKTFYQTKGTDEAFKILFKVLYAEDVKIIKPDDYCFTSSDDKWRIVESFICELVSGDPTKTKGQTLYQDSFPQYSIDNANGSIYDVETFIFEGKPFYKLQIFSGYSNNLNPKGSIEGTFVATPKTFVVEDTSAGSTVLTVDSTVGFGNTGTLEIDGLTVTYTNKTNNQFLNCTGITSTIARKTKIFSDHYVYAYESGDATNIVKFKLCNVLSKLESSDVLYAYEQDPIQISQLGSTEDSTFLSSLIYNIPISVSCGFAVNLLTTQIRNNQQEGFAISNGLVLCKYPHYLKTGDVVDMYIENQEILVASNLSVSVSSAKEFSVPILTISQSYGDLNNLLGKNILFRRHVKKSPYLDLTANIQDSYVDTDSYYLTSNGFPEYQINPLNFEAAFTLNPSNYTSLNASQGNHYFQTGDEVTVSSYTASSGFKNVIGIQTGISYYVNRSSNSQINLSQSRSDIENSLYITFVEFDQNNVGVGTVSNIILIPNSQYNQSFGSNKLFKKFPKNNLISNTKEETPPGNIGVFVNGIELKNYKSFDKIYYGKIDSIDVLNSGSNYNLNNPPQFKVIYDDVEYPNTKIIPQLKGSSIDLSITDPGFDYIEALTVKVLGGNNDTVVTQVKMKNVTNQVTFNATTKDTIINTASDKFVFNSKHNFILGEPVLYKTLGTTPIGIGTATSDGFLIDNSVYYVSNVGAGTSMSLAFNQTDALSQTKLINLRTYGGGFQSFISTVPRKGIDEVNIIQNEKDFEYKKLSFTSDDVNIQDNIIFTQNHGFSTGEEVLYTWSAGIGTTVGGTIVGLSSDTFYYVYKIDSNNFKLSTVKNTTNYVDFISSNNYTTYFLEYSPIRVQILGTISVSGVSTLGYNATIVPIVKGVVTGANIQKNPSTLSTDNFGNKNILNYEKNPTIEIVEGTSASLQPLVVDGRINEVVVKNSGSGYFNSLDLIITGNGFGAKLEPVISQGSITSIKIVNAGVGYASSNTAIQIVPIGKDVKLKAKLKSYTVDNIVKNGLLKIEDGAIFGKNYSNVGNTYGVYFLNQRLRQFLNIPNSPTNHSPIVGWAYDGCPIYGPYGFENIDGTGSIIRMRSGYTKQSAIGSIFTLVEDYVFNNSGTLDEYNGRFCVTPEYPNGIYAYFCTLDTTNKPEFPYVIGPKYNYTPTKENFDLKNNQTLNFNNFNIVKWTSPYRVKDNQYKYEYFEFFNNSNEKDIIVQKTSTGFVDEINILNGGLDYQVNDSVIFDDEGTSGFGAIAKISEIGGVGISSISTSTTNFSNVTFISDGTTTTGIASTYHSLKNNSYVNISGVSTSYFNKIEGFRKISTFNISTRLTSNLGSSSTTGIVTSIQVNEPINSFDVDSQIKINNEIVRVIGLDYKNNLINILRNSGTPSHTTTEVVELLSNKFTFDSSGITSAYSIKNESYYFNSTRSVSVGIDTSVGIGNTLTIYPLGIGVSYVKYVPTGGIYLPNNKFNTGDKVNYTSGTSTIVSNYGNLSSFSELYVLKIESDIVGLVTSKSNILNPNKILTYTTAGTGSLHKFTTNKNIIAGTVTKNECTVSTASTHGLSSGNLIKLNVTSGISTTFTVSYSSNRVLINSQVNPKINVYANDQVIFDISSATLSGKVFNLYTDENFENPYFGNVTNGIEVVKTAAQLTLNISEYTPRNLFYNLSSTILDKSVSDYNQLNLNNSLYNTEIGINSSTDYTFTFNLNVTPERVSYTTPSTLSYSVLSEEIKGPIVNVEILSKGLDYKKLPQIVSIGSSFGNGGNLFANSYTIGKILQTKVNNTQLICPSDKTLKPESKVFSSLKLTDNYTVSALNILSNGRNYITAPRIELYNLTDNQIISNFSASAILKNSSINEINLINPGYGLKSSDNQIIVTNNTNGFQIIGVSVVGTTPYVVSLTLRTPTSGFSTSNPLPISVGDEIFVENIIGIGNGFNCSDYDYRPFVATFVNPAYGSQDAAVVKYELTTNPGSYDSTATYNAYVIPYSYIPKIEAELTQNIFYNKEYVNAGEIIDNLNNSPITNIVKVKNSNNIKVNDIISGVSSKSQGKVIEIDNFNSTFTSDSSVSEIIGGQENRGYLSSNIQKLSDNDYYQKFSYSLKSTKSFSDWDSPVSDTSHIAGYKKFSDLGVESVGIGTTQSIKTDSVSTVNVILDSYGNINSIKDYDLVNEIDVDDTNGEYSQYLKFNRLKLGQSLRFTNNRVLSIDDISNLFNTQPIVPRIIVDGGGGGGGGGGGDNTSSVLKYEFYLSATQSFLGAFVYPEVFELLVTRNVNDYNLVSYSYYADIETLGPNGFFGSFSVDTNPLNTNESILYFTPTNPFVTVDIKAIKEIVPSTVGIATTTFGYTRNVELCNAYVASGSPTPQVFYTIPISNCKSGNLIVGISSISNNMERSFEVSFVNISNDIFTSIYSENTLNNLGTVGIATNGSNIEFSYTGVVGIGITLQTNLKLLTNTYAGYDSFSKTFSKFVSSQISSSSLSIGISTISGIYGYSKYIMEIEQTTGITTQRSIVQLNSIHAGNYVNNTVYDINGNISLNDLNFDTTYDIGGNTYTLYFNPVTSANYKITFYESSLLSPNQ